MRRSSYSRWNLASADPLMGRMGAKGVKEVADVWL